MADFFVGDKTKITSKTLCHTGFMVLLVANPYDAFILEEDGHLTEQILTKCWYEFYYAPRVTRVSTGQEAIKIITRKV